MGWKSFVKRNVKRAAKRTARGIKHQVKKRGRKLLSRGFRVAATAGATYVGGPAAGAFAAKYSKGVI